MHKQTMHKQTMHKQSMHKQNMHKQNMYRQIKAQTNYAWMNFLHGTWFVCWLATNIFGYSRKCKDQFLAGKYLSHLL
jgi:hypothetical protein